MANIRTFVAFELPLVVSQHVRQMIQEMSFLGDRVRWSRPENVHLTLKFLGDVPLELVPQISAVIKQVGQDAAPLTLCVSGVGGFPNVENARVIWLGVQGNVAGLRNLQSHLETQLTPLGFEPERRNYFPHVTLGRARRAAVSVDLEQVGSLSPIHFRVDRLTLIKSELRPEGAVYSPLFYGALKK